MPKLMTLCLTYRQRTFMHAEAHHVDQRVNSIAGDPGFTNS